MNDVLDPFRRRYPQYSHLSEDEIAKRALTDKQLANDCYQFADDCDAWVAQKRAERQQITAKLRAALHDLESRDLHRAPKNLGRGILGDFET